MPISAALLVYDDCVLHSLSRASGMMQLANRANEQTGRTREAFIWRVVSPDAPRPCQTGIGVQILPHGGLDERSLDVVFVSAFYDLGPERIESLLAHAGRIRGWLVHQWSAGAMLVAFGSGALLLAHAGLLDGRRATTIGWLAKTARERYPGVLWQDSSAFTESGRIYCSSSSSSDLPLLQRTISRLMSPRIASRCTGLLLEHAGLSVDTPQLMTSLDVFQRDPLLLKVDHWLEKNLSRGPTIAKLARSLGVSPRTLHRLTRREVSLSPVEFLLRRRIETACRLLERSPKSIYEVARNVGYSDGSVFSRAFRRRMGLSPNAYRARKIGRARGQPPRA